MRNLVIIGLILCSACLTSAPSSSIGNAQGAFCEQNLDCASGLYCLCERCISQESQIYPSQCPHIDLLSCDTSQGQCSADCADLSSLQEAECIENLWFCPNNTSLVQLCASQMIELDAGISEEADASLE